MGMFGQLMASAFESVKHVHGVTTLVYAQGSSTKSITTAVVGPSTIVNDPDAGLKLEEFKVRIEATEFATGFSAGDGSITPNSLDLLTVSGEDEAIAQTARQLGDDAFWSFTCRRKLRAG